jgi:DnaJ-class molecular chaperone
MDDRELLEMAAKAKRLEPKEMICSQCRGEGRIGGMDPAIGGKSCDACDGTGMQKEQDDE